jgi:hypothetical protein
MFADERTKYTPVRNDLDKRNGLWMVAGKRETVYARAELSLHARVNAVRGLMAREERKVARHKAGAAAADFDDSG